MITSQGIVSAGVMEETPQPTLEGTPAALAAAKTLEPTPSKTPASFTFSSVPLVPATGGEESSTSSPLVDPNLLWGASAAAAALAATAYALSRKEEKEEERKRQEEQSLAEANAKVAASEATKTANYIAKRTLEDKLGIPITSDIVACSAGLKGLYQNIVNTILGNPTEEIDEDLLSEIGNDLARYFNDQPIENGAQPAPDSVSWSEFVSIPVGPTLDDAPPAVDYSNLVSLFNQGEAGSNTSYVEYSQNQGTPLVNGITTFLNGTISVLGWLNNTIGKPIEKILGSVLVQNIYDFNLGAGKEIMLSNFTWFYASFPKAANGMMSSTTESTATQAGRIFGDILSIIFGVSQIGFGVFGGGVGVVVGCGTSLCFSSAPAAAVGATITVNGAITSASASIALGENIRTLMNNNFSENSSDSESESDSINSNVSGTAGANRAAQFGDGWSNASLDDVLKKYAPNATPVETASGKILYSNTGTGINVVYDKLGNYFRIENTNITGNRRYLDLNGNTLYNKVIGGRTIGIPNSDYQQMTHFNNID